MSIFAVNPVRGIAGLITIALLSASGAGAQQTPSWDATATRVTRSSLEALLDRYRLAAQSGAYSEELREEARDQAELVEERLTEGDFRAGDRVYVLVEDEPAITDTLSVSSDQSILLAGVGELPLAGVLRSELQDRVTQAVAQVIREPRVRTRSMVRISIDGAVGAPGYYLVEADEPLSDVLMRAGGYTGAAKLDRARIERASATIVASDRFETALRDGQTVDHLGLRDGDRVYVPAKTTGILMMVRELVFIIPAAIGFFSLIG